MTDMLQVAPYPYILEEIVEGLKYKPDWKFSLEDLDRGQGSRGLTFVVVSRTDDSYNHESRRSVVHYFIVPAASYDRRSWERWILDRLIDIETHETCEFMTIDGTKPFAPSHFPGADPYMVVTLGTEIDQRTSFRGELNPEKV